MHRRFNLVVARAMLLLALTVLGVGRAGAQEVYPLTAQNTNLVRRLYDAINARQAAEMAALLAPGFVDHDPAPGQGADGTSFVRATMAFFGTFPDGRMDVEAAIAAGNEVAIQARFDGTQSGAFLGIPATHKAVMGVARIDLWRVAGDRITEHWGMLDRFDLLRQLGRLPASVATPAGRSLTTPSTPAVAATPFSSLPAGTPVANAALARRFLEAGAQDPAALDQLLAPGAVLVVTGEPGSIRGREAIARVQAAQHVAFPDLRLTVADTVSEEPAIASVAQLPQPSTGPRRVVVRATWTGTQEGSFLGLAPTGKRVEVEQFDVITVTGGQIVDDQRVLDLAGLLTQLGALPGGA